MLLRKSRLSVLVPYLDGRRLVIVAALCISKHEVLGKHGPLLLNLRKAKLRAINHWIEMRVGTFDGHGPDVQEPHGEASGSEVMIGPTGVVAERVGCILVHHRAKLVPKGNVRALCGINVRTYAYQLKKSASGFSVGQVVGAIVLGCQVLARITRRSCRLTNEVLPAFWMAWNHASPPRQNVMILGCGCDLF